MWKKAAIPVIWLVVSAVGWVVWKLVEDAVAGWANTQLQKRWEMIDPAVQDSLLFTWLPPIVLMVAIAGSLWFVHRLGKRTATTSNDQPEFINLRDAVIDAWECIRNLPQFNDPPPSLPQFDSLREYYEADPGKMPGIIAHVIFNAADPPIPIKGISPPRTLMETIPADKAAKYGFSDDATELFDWFDEDKPSEQRKRYINLQVKRADIERRIKDMEGVE